MLQSLSLWREINTDMFKLWCLAEADLLSESNSYRLVNTGAGLPHVLVSSVSKRGWDLNVQVCICATQLSSQCILAAGQGMNRVQQAPHVSKAIHNILWRCQQQIGSWVGSSVSLWPPC